MMFGNGVWIFGAVVIGLLAFVAGVLVMRRRQMQQRTLDDLWLMIDTHPAAALPRLQSLVPQWERRVAQLQRKGSSLVGEAEATLSRARVTAALCCLALSRVADAESWETAARGSTPWPHEWTIRLCDAWLKTNPVVWPAAASQDLVDYLSLPETEQQVDRKQQILTTLLRLLELPADASPEKLRSVIELGQRILAVAPKLDEVQSRLGLSLQRAGRLEEALPHLQSAADADLTNVPRRVALAALLWELGQRSRARTVYLAAYNLQQHPDIALATGLACLRTEDIPFAADDGPKVAGRRPAACAVLFLSEACEQLPHRVDAWLLLAEAQLKQDQPQRALEALERVRSLDPAHPTGLSLSGRCRVALHDLDGARQILRDLKKADAETPDVWRLEGDIAFEGEDYVTTLPAYRKLSQATSDDPAVALRLARCELEAGDPQAALRLLDGRGPLDADATLLRGRSLARTGQWRDALKALSQEFGGVTSHEYAYYTANVLAANQQYAKALRLLDKLFDHPVWGARAARTAGHVLLLSGQPDVAEEHYRRVNDERVQQFDLGRLALVQSDLETASTRFHQCDAVKSDQQSLPSRMRVSNRQLRFAMAYSDARQGDTTVLDAWAEDHESLPYLQEEIAHHEFEAGRFKQALPLFEASVRQRDVVPTAILARLATGYLHQQRYREALPHLVAVARRRPQDRAVNDNLGYCRLQLAREHFRQRRWEAALLELDGVRAVFRRQSMPQLTAVEAWYDESRFRAAAQALTAERGHTKRAVELFQEAVTARPDSLRDRLGLILAKAAVKDHDSARTTAAEGVAHHPRQVGFRLALGLSLQNSGKAREARAAYADVLRLLSEGPSSERYQFLELATRMALGMSAAQDQEWQLAADTFQPLLAHPLLSQPGFPVGQRDVAAAMVAYYGLAGNKTAATELAQRYLPGESVGELLVAVVRAEAGDYAGAAETLERLAETDATAKIRALLIDCWLNVAAVKIRAGDFPGADAAVSRALAHDSSHKLARKLQNALRFAEQFRDFNPQALDDAIGICRGLMTESKSAQLVRTLGVLLHRKALAGDGLSPSTNDWNACVTFWTQHILNRNEFWKEFAEEYNTGKGKRERVKDEDLQEWRNRLPEDHAQEHAQLAVSSIRLRKQAAALAHLELIWRWKPDHKYEWNNVVQALGQSFDSYKSFLIDLSKAATDSKVTKFFEPAAVQIELDKALEYLTQMKTHRDLAFALIQEFQKGNAAAGFAARIQLQLARDAARSARDVTQRARKLAPGNSDVEAVLKVCNDVYNELDQICRQIGV